VADFAPDPLLARGAGVGGVPDPRGRHPAGRGWQRSALCDVEQVRRRWRPGDNVGIGCWKSGVVGLDLDIADGHHHTDIAGADTLAAQCAAHGEPWPDTLTIGTPSGGWHLYFRVSPGRLITSSSGGRSGLGPGIDVRGPGRGGHDGYLIGPGALLGGRRYDITHDAAMAELPASLVDLLEQAGRCQPGYNRYGLPHRLG
jgi:hypothetical protein